MTKAKKLVRTGAKKARRGKATAKPARKTSAKPVTPLDQMQAAYKAAVEEWIAAIKKEEALASVNHTIADVDKWEGAHFTEDKVRSKVKALKKAYEGALREKFFGF